MHINFAEHFQQNDPHQPDRINFTGHAQQNWPLSLIEYPFRWTCPANVTPVYLRTSVLLDMSSKSDRTREHCFCCTCPAKVIPECLRTTVLLCISSKCDPCLLEYINFAGWYPAKEPCLPQNILCCKSDPCMPKNITFVGKCDPCLLGFSGQYPAKEPSA